MGILDKNKVDGIDIIIRQIIAKNYEPEIEDIDNDKILDRPTEERVHVETFRTNFGFSGVDITKEMKHVDWNMNIKTLIGSLQGAKASGPSNDHLDLKVVSLVNTV